MKSQNLRIGTRKSRLAVAQTRLVVDLLRDLNPETDIEIVKLSSHGDERASEPNIAALGVGAFTSHIQKTLLDGMIDVAVHSLKDLPVQIVPGLELAATPIREDPSDAFVSGSGVVLEDLCGQASIGTSSPRRAAQIRIARPDLVVEPIRGDVETRIRKLDDGEVDGLILAAAGLIRLGLRHRISQTLAMSAFMPAPGQGALAVEIREGDGRVAGLVRGIDQHGLRACTSAERSVLSALGTGCEDPVGALAQITDGVLELQACSYRELARTVSVSGTPERAVEIGREAADLISMGADIEL